MVMMAAMPMMMPSMVRNDRSLWLQTPCRARLIFSNMISRLLYRPSLYSSSAAASTVRAPSTTLRP